MDNLEFLGPISCEWAFPFLKNRVFFLEIIKQVIVNILLAFWNTKFKEKEKETKKQETET